MSLTTAKPPARTSDQTAASPDVQGLFMAWKQDGDEHARDALVDHFTPLARKLTHRYGNTSEPFEDLLQVAMLGLLKALERFDPERGHAFQSFAIPTILGEMRRYFRDCGWAVHVPRSTQERALAVRDAHELLATRHGRAPTVHRLAQYLELDNEQVLDAMQALQGYRTISLESPRPGDIEDTPTYLESLGAEDEHYELIELDATVSESLSEVSPRSRRILHMRFVEDLTQMQIAERVGISQMQVSRLLRRSLEQLRAVADGTGGNP